MILSRSKQHVLQNDHAFVLHPIMNHITRLDLNLEFTEIVYASYKCLTFQKQLKS